MFAVKTRVIDDDDFLKTVTIDSFNDIGESIYGFIEVTVGEHRHGWYHENPLQHWDVSRDILDWWIGFLLDSANTISETNYAAFLIPDTYNTWLEFELVDDLVVLNFAKSEEYATNKTFIYEKNINFSYIESVGTKVKYSIFFNEIIRATNTFFAQLESINPDILKTQTMTKLQTTLGELGCSDN